MWPRVTSLLVTSLALAPGVQGQGRFLDDILKWRTDTSVLTPEAIK